jgi:hypothetical protein
MHLSPTCPIDCLREDDRGEDLTFRIGASSDSAVLAERVWDSRTVFQAKFQESVVVTLVESLLRCSGR